MTDKLRAPLTAIAGNDVTLSLPLPLSLSLSLYLPPPRTHTRPATQYTHIKVETTTSAVMPGRKRAGKSSPDDHSLDHGGA
jgi:hypothetical protein